MIRRRIERPVTSFELAQPLVPHAAALLELHRRFVAEEERLTAALGIDEPPSFEDFVAWIADRGKRPPGRPRGRRDRHPDAHRRRSQAQRRRRAVERATNSVAIAA